MSAGMVTEVRLIISTWQNDASLVGLWQPVDAENVDEVGRLAAKYLSDPNGVLRIPVDVDRGIAAAEQVVPTRAIRKVLVQTRTVAENPHG